MEKKFKFGVIGAGFMSSAIIKGILASNYLEPNQIIVSDISKDNLEKMSNLGVETTSNNNDILLTF